MQYEESGRLGAWNYDTYRETVISAAFYRIHLGLLFHFRSCVRYQTICMFDLLCINLWEKDGRRIRSFLSPFNVSILVFRCLYFAASLNLYDITAESPVRPANAISFGAPPE